MTSCISRPSSSPTIRKKHSKSRTASSCSIAATSRQVGSPQDVYDHPQTSFVYEFLGAANRLRGKVDRSGFVADGAVKPIAVTAGFEGPAFAYVRPHDLLL